MVELLVGVAVGLSVLAGATTLFANNVVNSRRLVQESRVNQDLRSSMDLMVRELRRGGYWGNAIAGATASPTSVGAAASNPYASVVVTGGNQVDYQYTRDATENNVLDATSEQFGFRLNTNISAVEMNIGGTWQTLTNTDLVQVTAFAITPTETSVDIRAACAKTCVDTSSAPSCPRVKVRTYNIVLTGQAKANAAVTRTLESQVRVRNDLLAGTCPV